MIGRAWNSLTRNKAKLGAAFLAAYSWAEVTSCPPVYGFDLVFIMNFIIAKWIGPYPLTCVAIEKFLGMTGVGLVAAGLLPKDDMVRRKQIVDGKIDPPLGEPFPNTRTSDRR